MKQRVSIFYMKKEVHGIPGNLLLLQIQCFMIAAVHKFIHQPVVQSMQLLFGDHNSKVLFKSNRRAGLTLPALLYLSSTLPSLSAHFHYITSNTHYEFL